ncbi:hypothetical protein LINPERPRIM_LOCUS3202 [Linum perenne]
MESGGNSDGRGCIHQMDSFIEIAIQQQKDQLSVELRIMRIVSGMQHLELKLNLCLRVHGGKTSSSCWCLRNVRLRATIHKVAAKINITRFFFRSKKKIIHYKNFSKHEQEIA